MTRMLQRRLDRLEAGVGLDLLVIFVGFANPDGTDPPTTMATINGCVWRRMPEETKDVFLERVDAEARPIMLGRGIIGFLE